VLVIEDSPDLAELLRRKLRQEGYDVRVEHDGLRGLSAARQDDYALIILDRSLPGLDGLEICRRVRAASEVPILMLTAAGDVDQRIEGLDQGANDYLAKPFDVGELLARVRAQVRARRPAPREGFALADLELHERARTVRRGEAPIALTAKEYDLLHHLLAHARQVVPRDALIAAVWGHDFEGDDNVLDVFIRRLRTKIERPGAAKLLHTVRGVGYVLREEAPR
jgi:two-component system response regulator MprA